MLPASESLPNFAGQLIDGGRFQLLDVLGSGAFGVVYRAVDNASSDDELVFYAVKCLLRSSKQPEAQMREFALQISVCDHPNIISIHDIICDDSYIYVIMDYCPGGDLFGAITERCLYQGNIELIRTAFLQLIDAVQACHDEGVFHRDLKPENVLCSEDGSHVYLSDFGLATKRKVCRDFGCGSVFYMSPGQL
jgi:serine/threonine protein kinase